MIFKQLLEQDSFTYTYLLGCEETGKSVLIDPVVETVHRDLDVIRSLGLTPTYTLETHVHADHISSGVKMRALADTQIVVPKIENLPCADLGVEEGTVFEVGNIKIHPLFTPGHTGSHHAYLIENGMHTILFSGDALLIEACGRTDFQEGNPAQLYKSIQDKLFSLPDETLVYPGHDYEGRQITTILQEKQRNPRLMNNKSEADFIEIMNGLDLPYPRKIDFAVPANQLCGQCPDNIPEEYSGPCEIIYGDMKNYRKHGDQG
ncbi:MAG: sulfur dioxygenase [Cocleimonas sp.]|jgi:sulfur dioxygenase